MGFATTDASAHTGKVKSRLPKMTSVYFIGMILFKLCKKCCKVSGYVTFTYQNMYLRVRKIRQGYRAGWYQEAQKQDLGMSDSRKPISKPNCP